VLLGRHDCKLPRNSLGRATDLPSADMPPKRGGSWILMSAISESCIRPHHSQDKSESRCDSGYDPDYLFGRGRSVSAFGQEACAPTLGCFASALNP